MKARRKQLSGPVSPSFPGKREESILDAGGIRCESVLYDFSSDKGAVGTITFGRYLPAGAIVTEVFSDEQTAFTSGGSATIQLKVGSTNLTDALAFDTDFTGVNGQALASSAEAIKVSARSELSMAIATAAVTAGKVRFFVIYMLPND